MMVEANLVLLDEVGAGVNRTLLNEISDAILRLNKERNYTFFVIEHDMDLVRSACSEVTVLDFGTVIASGPPGTVLETPQVQKAYMGIDSDQEAAE